MISLIPSPTLHIRLAKGHPGAQHRGNALSEARFEPTTGSWAAISLSTFISLKPPWKKPNAPEHES
jgi:hypothetical protein